MNKPKLVKRNDFKVPMGVLAGALIPDSQAAIVGCMDGVYQVNLESGKFEKLYVHDSYVSSVHYLENGQVLSAGYDGCVRWFDLASRQIFRAEAIHGFWSWDLDITADQTRFASVTGQYLAGGYKYEPQPEQEPSLRIGSIETGSVQHSLPHVPSVQAVAFSADGTVVAAGNLMGEVRVFDTNTGELRSRFTTDSFTSWGIIKSHSYLGGIFAMRFTPDDEEILLVGMGQMRDPMAGNGRQLWQKWSWKGPEPKMVDQTHEGESGEGLMEAIAVHPAGDHFLMGGRLRGGNWNVGLFSLAEGNIVGNLKTGFRVTAAKYSADGNQVVLFGTQGQPSKRDKSDQFPHFGRVEVYEISKAQT